jgi:hypothetical protein
MLGDSTELLLAASLPARALPFAREIVLQTAFPLGSAATPADAEIVAVRAVIDMLRSAAEGSVDLSLPMNGSVFHTRFVAAVFQNLDLLYESDFPHADAVSAAVLQAVWTADEDRLAIGSMGDTDARDREVPR